MFDKRQQKEQGKAFNAPGCDFVHVDQSAKESHGEVAQKFD
jgi:hypothetical protein